LHVNTVLGRIESKDLGITLSHEHIILNAWGDIMTRNPPPELAEAAKSKIFREKVSLSNLGALKLNCTAVLDNLIYDDVGLAVKEIDKFRDLGGNTIVEVTNEKMGRDVLKLKEISRETGTNIICSTGFYVDANHPDYVEEYDIDRLAEIMISEIEDGISDTSIKAGVIGEIGVSRTLLPDEEKVLKASAIAQKRTGAAEYIHIWPFGSEGIKVMDILEKTDIDPGKVVIGHVDGKIDHLYYRELLSRGVNIGFEHFGKEFREEIDNKFYLIPNDLERTMAIYQLLEEDGENLEKIMISTDRCLKMELTSYGGMGYEHILKNIVPMMRKVGFSQKNIDTLLIDNPRRLLEV
jgi:phosphotriesterase-related protein